MINIKNLTRQGKEKLFDDWFNIFSSIKMEQTSVKLVGYYSNYDPTKYTQAKEPVMCFKKIS